MLVTDAMPSVGGGDEFWLQGKHIRVQDGVCVDDQGTLAGSDLDMITAVRNTIRLLAVPLPRALEMASAVPARFLSIADRVGSIAPGRIASLVWLSDTLELRSVLVAGEAQGR
jgi:N-acetylglucosamine-6-phosphate deacetylase